MRPVGGTVPRFWEAEAWNKYPLHPKTNSQFAPENGCLEDDSFPIRWLVSFTEGMLRNSCSKKSTFQHQSEYKTWSLALFWRNFSRESHHRVHFFCLLLNCWTIPLQSSTTRKINMELWNGWLEENFPLQIRWLLGSKCSGIQGCTRTSKTSKVGPYDRSQWSYNP